jgi:type II secretory pathway pseudopilin PulG
MNTKRNAHGFSTIELVTVVAIMLMIGAMSTPYMLRTIGQMRLRSSAASLAGLLQQTRMRAVKDDRFYADTQGATAQQFCIDLNGNGACDTAGTPPEPMVDLSSNVSLVPAGGPSTTLLTCGPLGPSACPGGYQPLLNYQPEAGNVQPAFSARGLPCVGNPPSNTPTYPLGFCYTTDSSGPSSKPVGFLYLLQYNGMTNVTYAAVAVTPSGRVSVWNYIGVDNNGNDVWAQ